LVKRYQNEENKRLKIEEENFQVVMNMENTIKDLEKREVSSRSSISLSPLSSNKKRPKGSFY